MIALDHALMLDQPSRLAAKDVTPPDLIDDPSTYYMDHINGVVLQFAAEASYQQFLDSPDVSPYESCLDSPS